MTKERNNAEDFSAGSSSRAFEEAVRLTRHLRTSDKPYWACLRRRLRCDHGIDVGGVCLLDMWEDQAGDCGELASPERWVDFDFELRPDSNVDEDMGRFTGWSERALHGQGRRDLTRLLARVEAALDRAEHRE